MQTILVRIQSFAGEDFCIVAAASLKDSEHCVVGLFFFNSGSLRSCRQFPLSIVFSPRESLFKTCFLKRDPGNPSIFFEPWMDKQTKISPVDKAVGENRDYHSPMVAIQTIFLRNFPTYPL